MPLRNSSQSIYTPEDMARDFDQQWQDKKCSGMRRWNIRLWLPWWHRVAFAAIEAPQNTTDGLTHVTIVKKVERRRILARDSRALSLS